MSYSLKQDSVTNLWPDELKILTVDDDQNMLNLIRMSLEPAGFRILRTTKPSEGLDLALHEKPDMIILDIMMPDLDGFELLRRIRRHHVLAHIPVIVVSARACTEDQVRVLQLSANSEDRIAAYLGKPFAPADLLRTVKDTLVAHKKILIDKRQNRIRPDDTPTAVYASPSTTIRERQKTPQLQR
jgi:DNA-binding response OmpR family regulator